MKVFKQKQFEDDELIYQINLKCLSFQAFASGYFCCIAEECEKVASEIYHAPAHWSCIIKMQNKKTVFLEILKQNQYKIIWHHLFYTAY